MLLLLVAAEELDVEGFGKVLAQVVTGAGLQRLGVLHERFDAVGGVGTGEFFAFGLGALDDWDRQNLFGEGGVDVEHAQRFLLRLLGGLVGGVTFLPEELGRSQEEARAHFPAHHVAPLVDQDGQVAVALHPLGVHVTDHRLGRGADDHSPLHRRMIRKLRGFDHVDVPLVVILRTRFDVLGHRMRNDRVFRGSAQGVSK